MDIEKLRSDQRAIDALEMLKARGVSEPACEGLLHYVASLPAEYESVTSETQSEAVVRRNSLATRMKDLARLLRDDPEASLYHPSYGGVEGSQPQMHIDVPFSSALTLADWLEEGADHLNAEHEFENPQSARVDRRVKEKTFVLRRIFDKIEHYRAVTEDGKVGFDFSRESRVDPKRGPSVGHAINVSEEGEKINMVRSETPRPLPIEPGRSTGQQAHNVETELLASALLDDDVAPGTVTHLRKDERRRYEK